MIATVFIMGGNPANERSDMSDIITRPIKFEERYSSQDPDVIVIKNSDILSCEPMYRVEFNQECWRTRTEAIEFFRDIVELIAVTP
jgi:hypothetical protein